MIVAEEEESSDEVGTGAQGSERANDGMGSKRGVRRSLGEVRLPVGARGEVRRPQMGSVVVLRGGGGRGGGDGMQEGSG